MSKINSTEFDEMWDAIETDAKEERKMLYMDFSPIPSIEIETPDCFFIDDWQV